MNSLLIDTCQKYLHLEIWEEKAKKIEKFLLTQNNVSEKLIPLVQETLSEVKMDIDDIDEIVLVNGPGSFTGVRVGLTFAKMMACFGVKIKTISSLKAMASNYLDKGRFVMPVIDARSKSVFSAIYKLDEGKLIIHKEEGLYKLEEIKDFIESTKEQIDVVTYDNLFEEIANKKVVMHVDKPDIKLNLAKVEKLTSDVDDYHMLEPIYMKTV